MSQDATVPINLSVIFLCIYIGTPPFITFFKVYQIGCDKNASIQLFRQNYFLHYDLYYN